MFGGIDPEEPRHYPGPLSALFLTMTALFAMVLVVLAFGTENVNLGSLGVGQALGFGVVATLAARLVPEPQAERLGLRGFELQHLPALLLLIPVVFAVSELDNWITDFAPPGENTEQIQELIDQEREKRTPMGIAQGAIVRVGIAPVVEEWLYRGVILQGVIAHLGMSGGLLFSSLLFAFGSAVPSMAVLNPLSLFVTTTLLGLMLGFVRLATGSLLAPILLHGVFNAIGFLAITFADDYPIRGFNTNEGHSSLTLVVPSVVSVCIGISLLMRGLREQPITIPLPPRRPRAE